jgi:hypothetical protein
LTLSFALEMSCVNSWSERKATETWPTLSQGGTKACPQRNNTCGLLSSLYILDSWRPHVLWRGTGSIFQKRRSGQYQTSKAPKKACKKNKVGQYPTCFSTVLIQLYSSVFLKRTCALRGKVKSICLQLVQFVSYHLFRFLAASDFFLRFTLGFS